MKCSECDKKAISRGLCSTHYHRMRRNGTVVRQNVPRSSECSVEGCHKEILARGFCARHYASDYQHPLKSIWKLLRSRAIGAYPPEWEKFDAFLADVGERPHPKSQLRRLNPLEAYSKENVRWTVPYNRPGYMTKEERSRYSKNHHRLKKFGLTEEEFHQMLHDQGNKCAICLKDFGGLDEETGNIRIPHIDHCHGSKIVRELLCLKCNGGIGFFGEDPARMCRAAAYVEKHAKRIKTLTSQDEKSAP